MAWWHGGTVAQWRGGTVLENSSLGDIRAVRAQQAAPGGLPQTEDVCHTKPVGKRSPYPPCPETGGVPDRRRLQEL